MATELPIAATNGQSVENHANGSSDTTSFTIKTGLARMLQGGVIMDVVNVEQVIKSFSYCYGRIMLPFHCLVKLTYLLSLQARIAEEAGAVAVMALERVPADIRVQGGVARMSDPKMIKEIIAATSIPVMAKARIGHFVECQVSKPA
jgi:pyridoxal 5'-phosphate synthase pdxS subunit